VAVAVGAVVTDGGRAVVVVVGVDERGDVARKVEGGGGLAVGAGGDVGLGPAEAGADLGDVVVVAHEELVVVDVVDVVSVHDAALVSLISHLSGFFQPA
jgi:hypothetical protein